MKLTLISPLIARCLDLRFAYFASFRVVDTRSWVTTKRELSVETLIETPGIRERNARKEPGSFAWNTPVTS
jgi:hypothetical protein